MNEGRLIKRDPFARTELRRVNTGEKGTCDWCGVNTGTYVRPKYLYRYLIETDGCPGRTHDIYGRFCSIGCMRAYHGEV
jgi:hypothetical protein